MNRATVSLAWAVAGGAVLVACGGMLASPAGGDAGLEDGAVASTGSTTDAQSASASTASGATSTGQRSGSDTTSSASIATASRSSGTGSVECGTILASDYDRSCTQDSDCVGVASGMFCTGNCACDNEAINRAALTSYMADFPDVKLLACPCAAAVVFCAAGTCTYPGIPK